jgi:hypothetical protein
MMQFHIQQQIHAGGAGGWENARFRANPPRAYAQNAPRAEFPRV